MRVRNACSDVEYLKAQYVKRLSELELSRWFADNIADIFRCPPVCGFEKIERNSSEIGRLEG